MKKIILVMGLCAGIAACSNDTPTNAVDRTAGTATPVVAEPQFVPSTDGSSTQTVLGLTDNQLLDASILDSAGMEIGEVEGLIRNPAGTISHVVVEVEKSRPDKFVEIAVDQLTAVRDRDDWDLQAPLTLEDLQAMAGVGRPTTPVATR